MSCPSCGAVHSWEECPEFAAAALASESHSNQIDPEVSDLAAAIEAEAAVDPPSRLIEFPGVTRRSLPPWRKELSERVREVQERRAREAAVEKAEAERRQREQSRWQLELLPQVDFPDVNPIVAAALRRIERAHRAPAANAQPVYRDAEYLDSPEQILPPSPAAPKFRIANDRAPANRRVVLGSAAATATAPAKEMASSMETAPAPERTRTLVVVQPTPIAEEKALPEKPAPRRMLSENDPALAYLDSVNRAYATVLNDENQAPLVSRLVAGLIDLICVIIMALPFLGLLEWQGGDSPDPLIAWLMVGIVAVVLFLYLTVSTALTGKTLGLKLLSLRAIDSRTGLIPTGSQSAGRALVYIFSLATFGLGFLVAATNSERKTVHDRLSRTAVVRA